MCWVCVHLILLSGHLFVGLFRPVGIVRVVRQHHVMDRGNARVKALTGRDVRHQLDTDAAKAFEIVHNLFNLDTKARQLVRMVAKT